MIGQRFGLEYVYQSTWPPTGSLERNPRVIRKLFNALSYSPRIHENVKGDIIMWFCVYERLALTRGKRSCMLIEIAK